MLCAAATVCIAANFVSFPARRPMAAAARASAAAKPAVAPETFSVPAPLRIAGALSSWRMLFPDSQLGRDPFALILVKPPPVAPPSPSPASGPLEPPTFQLHAVSIEGDRALAIVNHRVLAVGESIGDYQLEKIQPDRVQFRSRWGRVVVPLVVPPPVAAQNSASGTFAPADLPAKPGPAFPTSPGR